MGMSVRLGMVLGKIQNMKENQPMFGMEKDTRIWVLKQTGFGSGQSC